jgi:hypothetical protein
MFRRIKRAFSWLWMRWVIRNSGGLGKRWRTAFGEGFWVDPIEMANGTKGWGKPLPLDSHPMGGQTRLSPQTPLGNFYGLVLRIALGATRGDAELETDRERFECQWNIPMGGQWARRFDGAARYICRGAACCAHPCFATPPNTAASRFVEGLIVHAPYL